MIKKFVSPIVTIALVMMTSGIYPFVATAANATITTASDTMTRLKASTPSDHEIKFVTPTGVAVGQTVTVVFSAGFTGVGNVVVADVDFAEGSSGTCSSATFTERSMGTGTTQYNAVGATQTVTITAGATATPITAGRCVRIRIGANATDVTGSGPGTTRISNGATGSADTITIGGTFTDSGTISVEIMDDDQVSVSASVNQTMTFDLDTAADFTNGESVQPYAVPLGVLAATAVTHSNGTSIRMIVVDGGTNASGGMNVTVKNANGTNGLISTAVNTDKIASATGTMAVGTANYGLCVATAGLTGFTRATGYVDDTCSLASGTNQVRALSTTPTNILTSTAPVATGQAEIVVNAEISNSTPAHTDYTDTLTFIATATF